MQTFLSQCTQNTFSKFRSGSVWWDFYYPIFHQDHGIQNPIQKYNLLLKKEWWISSFLTTKMCKDWVRRNVTAISMIVLLQISWKLRWRFCCRINLSNLIFMEHYRQWWGTKESIYILLFFITVLKRFPSIIHKHTKGEFYLQFFFNFFIMGLSLYIIRVTRPINLVTRNMVSFKSQRLNRIQYILQLNIYCYCNIPNRCDMKIYSPQMGLMLTFFFLIIYRSDSKFKKEKWWINSFSRRLLL